MSFRALPPRRCNISPPFPRRAAAPRRRRPPSPQALLLLRLGLCLLLVFGSFFLLDYKVRPVVSTMSRYQAQLICTRAINEAVKGTLESEAYQAAELVSLHQDSTGQVTSLSTDAGTLSRIKADITLSAVETLRIHGAGDLSVPMGTLMNSQLLMGRGPAIPFKVVPTAAAEVDIKSEFLPAGINQTVHRLSLQISVAADAILPGSKTPVETATTFILAETVLLGDVPDAYTNVTGDDRALTSKLFDFRAG